ncbi:hypothetical protein CCR75_004585 [Bremia lactucae]|uniref:Uncharacterized protein n=1 Tax=Bremia lactucae TaxID=4779 RepID=A0A976IEP0_BRELC|nr:hypothetical protein CCR75_004585 [Bremia lactucae]
MMQHQITDTSELEELGHRGKWRFISEVSISDGSEFGSKLDDNTKKIFIFLELFNFDNPQPDKGTAFRAKRKMRYLKA